MSFYLFSSSLTSFDLQNNMCVKLLARVVKDQGRFGTLNFGTVEVPSSFHFAILSS